MDEWLKIEWFESVSDEEFDRRVYLMSREETLALAGEINRVLRALNERLRVFDDQSVRFQFLLDRLMRLFNVVALKRLG
jgi:hypothetical protein